MLNVSYIKTLKTKVVDIEHKTKVYFENSSNYAILKPSGSIHKFINYRNEKNIRILKYDYEKDVYPRIQKYSNH